MSLPFKRYNVYGRPKGPSQNSSNMGHSVQFREAGYVNRRCGQRTANLKRLVVFCEK